MVDLLYTRPLGPRDPSLVQKAKLALGLKVKLPSHDREVLEDIIIPHFATKPDVHKILFVGCVYFTRHYQTYFSKRNYYTIEPDEKRAKWGAKKHIVDRLENLDLHFQPGFFDLIICNGVYGWGLNEKEKVEKALSNCRDCLRSGGYFVFGWNDTPERSPLAVDELKAMRKFKKVSFQPFGNWRYLCRGDGRHIFDFYRV